MSTRIEYKVESVNCMGNSEETRAKLEFSLITSTHKGGWRMKKCIHREDCLLVVYERQVTLTESETKLQEALDQLAIGLGEALMREQRAGNL